jgi:phosphopantothenoylcysteine decarboxylase/phosphopantothenate--cysteine ligase
MPSAETKLQGKNILVTAGPTVEYWDSVRYLTNRASGKTGLEIAHYARTLGAQVTLVSSIKSHAGYDVRHILISSARDMFKVVKEEYGNCDIFISSAAVADFRPVYVKGKIDKRKGMPEIKLKRNPDILKWAGDNKERQVIAGFSLQEKIDIKKAKLKKTATS